ncbi:MAG TPA: hypothetical protein VJ773_00740 [Gemmatimonadales bacterium]|nr:hypothetical protein [Gemmatimonadales bacterium]
MLPIRGAPLTVLGLAGVVLVGPSVQAVQALWQADVVIRSLSVTRSGERVTALVVVGAELGEATAVRVEVMLPVGVGLLDAGQPCRPGPSAPGVSALHARVVCPLGNLPSRGSRELRVATTVPPPGIARSFAVMALSDTPDPRPSNNYAEKVIP